MSRTTCKILQHFSVWRPQIKRNEVMFCFYTKYYGKVTYTCSNSQLEWFITFLWNTWTNCHMSYGTQRNPPPMDHFSVYFITIWCFPQDSQWISLLYSSTIKWLWNKHSFHICLDCRIENNMKISNFSSTESPWSWVYSLHIQILSEKKSQCTNWCLRYDQYIFVICVISRWTMPMSLNAD